MSSSLHAEFVLLGEGFDPDEVTRRLGLMPTKTWLRGDSMSTEVQRRKQTGWKLSTNEVESHDLAKEVSSLVASLSPVSAEVVRVQRDMNLEAIVLGVVYMKGAQGPGMEFDRELLDGIAALGAQLRISVYAIE